MWERVCPHGGGEAGDACRGPLALVCVFRDADRRPHNGRPAPAPHPGRVTPATLMPLVQGLSFLRVSQGDSEGLCL